MRVANVIAAKGVVIAGLTGNPGTTHQSNFLESLDA